MSLPLKILTLQFLVTVGMSAAAAFVLPIRNYVSDNLWLMFLGIGLALGCLVALFCCKTAYPVNVVLLAVFTLGYGYV